MITAVLILYIFVVLLMTGTILLQKSESGGLVSSVHAGLVTNRGVKNFLTRLTAILATLFFVLSILLAILFRSQSSGHSSLLDAPASVEKSASEPEAPAAKPSISDETEKNTEPTEAPEPAAPVAK